MRRLSFVLPYYDNPAMLAHQYAVWAAYPADLKSAIEIVIVDDGSPETPAATVPRPEGLPPLRIFRVTVDRPWHQHGARNLGAHMARGPWLFLTDMDHVLPAESLRAVLAIQNKRRIYNLRRLNTDGSPMLDREGAPKPHPNTFILSRKLFWEIGGYDEDYCGIYGTDALFRARAFRLAGEWRILPDPIIRYSREDIPDASTRTLPRKEGRDPDAKAKVDARKFADGRAGVITTLAFPWVQAY